MLVISSMSMKVGIMELISTKNKLNLSIPFLGNICLTELTKLCASFLLLLWNKTLQCLTFEVHSTSSRYQVINLDQGEIIIIMQRFSQTSSHHLRWDKK